MILTKSTKSFFNIDEEIEKKISSAKLHELLLLFPTNRKIRSFKKKLISASPAQASGRLHLETIGSFSTKLFFNKTEYDSNLLSEGASAILLKQSFQELKLKYFSAYKNEIPTGTLSKIKNVISEYKKHGITPGKLRAESNSLSSSEKIKALDIADLYEAYNKKCFDLKVHEIGDVYSGLTALNKEVYENNFRQLFPNVSLIVVMGFDEFTAPEIKIINSAAEITNCELFLSFDYYRYNPLVFSHLDKCYIKLIEEGFREVEDRSWNVSDKFIKDVKEKLFTKKNKTIINSFRDDITVIKALNREKEIELIAKEVKQLIVDKKIEPHKICVTFNLIGNYSPVIRDKFSLYNIPINLTDRSSLSTSPPVISIINFLEILEDDFYYKNIFRALNGSFLNLNGVNLSNLLKASVRLKIISGYENWINILTDALNRLDDDYEDDSESGFIEKEIYSRALSDIKKIAETLAPFHGKMSLREFKENLESLIYSLNIPVHLINHSQRNVSGLEENIKAITTFINSINEMLDLFHLEYDDKQKFSLKFYLNNIRTMVSSTRFNIKEKPNYGVQITTMNEIRGLQFDYLFLSGLTDGDFPTRFSPEIFFSGSFAKSEQNHQIEERYLFYQSLCSWKEKLYLTYSLQDDRKELSKSNFLSEFTSIFAVNEKIEENYADTLFSAEELQIELGRNGIDKIHCYPEAADWINAERIKHGIEVDRLRMNDAFGESEYTGQIGEAISADSKNALEEFRSANFSITQLETFAKCPFRYFVERVLGLQPAVEPTEEIEAVEMGSLLHEILYEFYKQLKNEGISLSGASQQQFKYAEDLIFNIAQQKIEEAGFYSSLAFYEKEKILGINGVRKNSLLYKFLLNESRDQNGFIPALFEKTFGRMDEPNTSAITAGEIFVRGKIDRIDLNPVDKTYKIIDYKLGGKKPSLDQIYEGISLQLPLYMYAAKKLIQNELEEEFKPAGAEIYSLKFSEKDFGNVPVRFTKEKKLSPEEITELNEEVTQLCIRIISKYVHEISSGKFPLSQLPDRDKLICDYCNYKSICRIQEVY